MVAAWIVAGLSAVGVLQAAVGTVLVWLFAHRPRRDPVAMSTVTVLKPLYGDEPLLEEALTTVCRQNYPNCQVVFGVQDPADTALPVVRRLLSQFTDCDIAVVVDPTPHGRNGKVANLINMLPAAKHEVLVIADSDVHVAPDWLRRLVGALETPGVGLVTTVYTGLPVHLPQHSSTGRKKKDWLLPTFGAIQINQYFLPGALLARAMGRQDCLGATMALRRETLDRVGGFSAMQNHLADDNVLGQLVRDLGLKVALADTIPATTVPETTLSALWRHELRWARTIRTLAPVPFAASVIQYPLVWAALAMLLTGAALWSLAWFALAWTIRALAARIIDRALGLAIHAPLWLLPLRELMSVAVMVTSYAGRHVEWRGHTMRAEGFNPR